MSSRTSMLAGRVTLAAVAAVTAASLAACGPTADPKAGASAIPGVDTSSPGGASDPSTPASPQASGPTTSAPASAKPTKPASAPTTHSPAPGHSGAGGGSGSGSGTPVQVPAGSPQAVQAAFNQAKADGKEVLLDFGSPSCFACVTVNKLYKTASVQAELNAHYHLVSLDIDTNMKLLQHYDNSGSYAMPVLIVVTPGGIIRTNTNKTGHPKLTESGLLGWLQQWAN